MQQARAGGEPPGGVHDAVEVGQTVAPLVGHRPQREEGDARGGRDPRERGALQVDREAVETGAVGRRARDALGAHHHAAAAGGRAEQPGVGREPVAAALVENGLGRDEVAHAQVVGEGAAEPRRDDRRRRVARGQLRGRPLGGGGAHARDVDRQTVAGQPRERSALGGHGAHHRDHDRASVTRSRGLENASRMVLASYPQCIRQFAHRGSRSVPYASQSVSS